MAARPTPRLPKTFRSDADVLAQHHRFIRTVEDDAQVLAETNSPAELRLARRYYDRLFKEYAIADLSLAQQRRDAERQLAREAVEQGGDEETSAAAAAAAAAQASRRRLADLKAQPPPQIGLRWRTRAEVVSGRGHLSCGNRTCSERAALSTFELPFRWRELGEQHARAALVKVRLCPRCAALLPRGGGGGSGDGGGGGRRREEVERHREKERAEPTTARRRRAATRSRSRSPPPPQAAAAAAAAAAAPVAAAAARAAAAAAAAPGAGPALEEDNDDADADEDDARMDRLVQDMIDAFEAGAG